MRALEHFRPDLILIEGPPDAEALIPSAADPEMIPPVAMLVFNPKNLEQASFFPYAEFSPEWQAILYGLKHKIPLRFMDLPMSLAFGLREEQPQLSLDLNPTTARPNAENEIIANDPFRKIALLAGYSDPERWWDAMLERWTPDDGVQESEEAPESGLFPVILDLMRALRDDKTRPESRETLLREAHMRQAMRAAQKEGFARIAVVCGAWHGPALADIEKTKATVDAALLKGLKKVKTKTT